MNHSPNAAGLLAALILAIGSTGCAREEPSASTPPLENRADSIAYRVFQSSGGSAWTKAPYLRFDFAPERDGERRVAARHLWNRTNGDYRVEMLGGPDTTYVVLFNVDTREGTAYMKGTPVDSTRQSQLLDRAYRRFINDTYWLLAPLKLLDPGVQREFVADSSTSQYDVLTISFDSVGLTPGDRYWIYVDRETGLMTRWAYRLQHMDPDAPPNPHAWVDYEQLDTPNGPVYLAERKVSRSGSSLRTDNLSLPQEVPAERFSDPTAMLE